MLEERQSELQSLKQEYGVREKKLRTMITKKRADESDFDRRLRAVKAEAGSQAEIIRKRTEEIRLLQKEEERKREEERRAEEKLRAEEERGAEEQNSGPGRIKSTGWFGIRTECRGLRTAVYREPLCVGRHQPDLRSGLLRVRSVGLPPLRCIDSENVRRAGRLWQGNCI